MMTKVTLQLILERLATERAGDSCFPSSAGSMALCVVLIAGGRRHS